MRTAVLCFGLTLAALLVGLTGCTSDPAQLTDETLEDDPARRAPTESPRRYRAEWIIDPASAGRDSGRYFYLETVDDFAGSYSVQSPLHRAVQTREEVAICADILRPVEDVKCASIERPDGVPDVASIAITRLREWSPRAVFEVIGEPSMAAAAAAYPAAWTKTNETHRSIPVRCWTVVSETSAAPLGFKICFTDDTNTLVASLDLTGDLNLEVDMQRYDFSVTEDEFELIFTVIKDSVVYEQLLFIFPEVPISSGDETDLARPGATGSSE